MAGRQATADRSVLMASSCDGDVMGLIYVMPAQEYPAGTRLPMYWNLPRPATYAEYQANVRKGYELVGHLSVDRTYRTIVLAGNVESMTTGGMNEFGLTIAIEFIPMRSGLASSRGVVGPNSNHWTTSLIANGLMRARTAREAIRIIGSMAEQYGFQYYRASAGQVSPCRLPTRRKSGSWRSSAPGRLDGRQRPARWRVVRQRVPDGEVGCSANRSRIGKVDLADSDRFLASPTSSLWRRHSGSGRRASPLSGARCTGAPAAGRTPCGNGGR